MKKLGIIGAMTVEVEALQAQMQQVSRTQRAGMTFCEGLLEGTPAVVVQCGVGKVNAALCVQVLCDCFGVTHLINTGVAGSLCAQLDIGDLVISRDAMYHDFTCSALNPKYLVGQIPDFPVRQFTADPQLVDLAMAAVEGICPGHAQIGRVASGDQFVASREQKDRIVADTQALCTEMEGAAIAHAAWCNRVPFVIIRAISDKADASAEMDYPTFEAMAAQRCAAVTQAVARTL